MVLAPRRRGRVNRHGRTTSGVGNAMPFAGARTGAVTLLDVIRPLSLRLPPESHFTLPCGIFYSLLADGALTR